MPHGRGTVDPHDLPEQPSTPTAGAPRASAGDPDMLVPVCRLAFPQGIAGSERPPRGLGWHAHPNPPRCHARHRKRWVAPTTASVSGAAQPPRRPWCNPNPDNDMRSREHARPNRVSAHMHPNSHVRFRIGIRPPPHGAVKSRLQRDGSNTTTDPSSRREAPEAALGRPPVPRRQEPGSNRTRATRRTSSESLVVPYSLDSVTQGTSPTLTRRGQRYRATRTDPS